MMTKARDPKDLPTYEYMSECLSYDPETGVLTWKERPREMFALERSFLRWNTMYAHKKAGAVCRHNGYAAITLGLPGKRVKMYAHRVAWLLHTGSWPELYLDHINGNRQDNRIENLRQVTYAENHKNQQLSGRNTSGHFGVYYNPKCPKHPWQARISSYGKVDYLGSYVTKEEAIAVRKEAERKYGFHENHGRITDD